MLNILFICLLIPVSGMQPTDNMTLIDDLNTILKSQSYNQTYQPGVFDCIDSCAITQEILAQHGYNSTMIARLVPISSDEESHVWLIVPDGSSRYAFIETTLFAFGMSVLGGVVVPEDVREMSYDRGYIFDGEMKDDDQHRSILSDSWL